MARVDVPAIAGGGFGISGYDFPSDRAGHLSAISALSLSCPFEVVNDGIPGLLAGAEQGIGVNVTAGSSVNCRGRGPDGREGRIVGNGMAFGEFGGAIEIVQRGLQMVNYAWIKRLPPTTLTQVYLDDTGAKDELDLMEGLSNGRYQLTSHLAIQVIETAKAGDRIAGEVIHWAGEELGWLAVAVARQIGMENDAVEIIQSGSLFDAGELLIAPMRAIISQQCPRAKLMRLNGPPVVGAVILGMEIAGFNGYSVRNQLIETALQYLT
jgi:N-acetylglucosamine kinase-like BadF-type ATPase